VSVAQDRLIEKTLLAETGIPVAEFYSIESLQDLHDLAKHETLPFIIKTRRFGYDGKGQALFKETHQAAHIWSALGEVPMIAEKIVRFSRELSLIAVRNLSGEVVFYPLCENRHENGILAQTRSCSEPALQKVAEEYACKILDRYNYVGVLTIEFFDCEGKLLVNEIAPRVHNSGHWTIEASVTSQFENHIRAILNLPLGSTDIYSEFIMYNLVSCMPSMMEMLSIRNTHVHDYNKTQSPRRKLGHVTLCPVTADSKNRLEKLLTE
jgi:5-(carboxyamino)imidazole ribonucleotide synthase